MDRPFPAYQGDEPYIFVSYSHEDSDVVLPGIQQLRDQGFNIWYDEGISPGASWREELAESILGCDLFIILISPRSADSNNCLKELNYALEHDRPVLAIHLEPTQLSPGLELALNDRQAIFRYELTEEEYRDKVLSGVKTHIQQGQSIDTVVTSSVTNTTTKPILIGATLIAIAIVVGSLLMRPSEDVSNSTSGPVIDEKQEPATAMPEPVAGQTPSIAVLPFEDMSAELDQGYLGRGIAEELINGLSKLDGLRVASRTSSFYYAKQDLPITTIAERLKVRHILEGSIRKAGNRVRITMQLIDAQSDTHLLSETYDRDLDDLFAVQDEIASEVVKSLEIALGFESDQPIIDAGTENIEAFEEYQKARDAVSVTTAASLIRAEQHARRAIELDPGYTWAYQILFTTIGIANLYGVYSDQQVKELKQSLLTSWEEHNSNNDSDLARYTQQLFTADIERNVLLQEESLRYLILHGRAEVGSYVDVLNSVGEYSLARRFLLFSTGEAVQRNAHAEFQLGILGVGAG